MRAILIDPIERDVTEVDYDGDIQTIYDLCDIECFDSLDMGKGDRLFVDDEGRMKPDQCWFRLGSTTLCGKALVLGITRAGNSKATRRTLAQVQSQLTWLDTNEVDLPEPKWHVVTL